MKNALPATAATATDAAAIAAAAAAIASTLSLQVRQVRLEATGIHSFELVDPDGADLPPFSAGAHLDIHLAGGVTRQYSISSDPAEAGHYVIGVLRDEAGRGGSKAVHETLRVGHSVQASRPRNNFALQPEAHKVILLAGGIGVTPLKAMAHELDRAGVDYALHYCARNARCAAFGTDFKPLRDRGRVHYHFDEGVPGQGLDIAALLASPSADTHVYYCGPAGFMKACAAATAAAGWPRANVHFEHFKAPVDETAPVADAFGDSSFAIRIHSSGVTVAVGAGQTIVEALQGHGVRVETSCQAGLCGTCKVRYLSGEVDHRDFILSDGEHAEYLTACISRARSAVIELDL